MKYCARCLYPANAKPTIILDEEGVCSGCRYHESRKHLEIDWEERQEVFEEILDEARKMAHQRGNAHDCIIPVSGGKDSQFQVWLLTKKYGMNPLLVKYNHAFNAPSGVANLETLVEKSGCDLERYTAGLDSVRRISRYMVEKVGDITWHYHAGIRTYPFQVAVARNIPLIIWGEHGFAELTGIVSLEDFVEFTKWTRKEHDMRGIEAHELIGQGDITEKDIAPYVYPSDEDIARVGVRGIYLSNFIYWDGKKQAEKVMEEWGFQTVTYKRERTFNLHAKLDDHANDIHDYMKYLKFGYGRGTDDASMEIRHGRMTREEGIEMVRQYDATTPSTLPMYCDFMGISVEEFYKFIEPMRDHSIWEKTEKGVWQVKDSVVRHPIGPWEERAKLPINNDHTFAPHNRALYYNDANPPKPCGDPAFDVKPARFKVL